MKEQKDEIVINVGISFPPSISVKPEANPGAELEPEEREGTKHYTFRIPVTLKEKIRKLRK